MLVSGNKIFHYRYVLVLYAFCMFWSFFVLKLKFSLFTAQTLLNLDLETLKQTQILKSTRLNQLVFIILLFFLYFCLEQWLICIVLNVENTKMWNGCSLYLAATVTKVNHFILVTSLGTNKIGFPAAILKWVWKLSHELTVFNNFHICSL